MISASDERLTLIAPQPPDRSRIELRLERFPRSAADHLSGRIGPLANLRSAPGCGLALRSDAPWVELRLTRLRHHQPAPAAVALTVEHSDGRLDRAASQDLRPLQGDVAVRLPTSLERGGPTARLRLWLPCISTTAITGLVLPEGSLIEADREPAPRLLVCGDSLAQGFCVQDPTQTWVQQVAEGLGVEAWNLGVGGLTIEPEVFAWALERRWERIIVALGSNHAWSDREAERAVPQAEAFLALLAQQPHVTWILPPWKPCESGLGPPEFMGVPLDRAAGERALRIRNDLRALLAQQPQIHVLEDLMPHDHRLLADGLHPAALGMAAYAAGVLAGLGAR